MIALALLTACLLALVGWLVIDWWRHEGRAALRARKRRRDPDRTREIPVQRPGAPRRTRRRR